MGFAKNYPNVYKENTYSRDPESALFFPVSVVVGFQLVVLELVEAEALKGLFSEMTRSGQSSSTKF